MSKPLVHVSDILQMAKCGMQWWYRRGASFGLSKRNMIKPPNVAMAVGTAVHSSAEKNMRHKIDTGDLLTASDVKDAARDRLIQIRETEGLLFDTAEAVNEDKTIGNAIDEATALAFLHWAEFAPNLHPFDVERRFVIELPDFEFDLAGQIDLVQRAELPDGGVIWSVDDYKTSSSVDRLPQPFGLQMGMYCEAARLDPEIGGENHYPDFSGIQGLVKKKVPQAVFRQAVPNAEWVKPLWARIRQFAGLIKLAEESGPGVFTPAPPSEWICTARWCGYALNPDGSRHCRYYSGESQKP